MTLRHWLTALGLGRIRIPRSSRSGRLRRRKSLYGSSSACCELLEDRTLLTVYTVNSIGDSIANDGVVTLREAINAANTNTASGDAAAGSVDGDVIRLSFNTLQRLRLSPALGEFAITDDLVIDGTGSPVKPALSGEQGVRVFRINAGSGPGSERRVEFRSFNIVAGQGVGAGGLNGGAILVQAGSDLTLRDVSVSGKTPVGLTPTKGGGIYNAGRLSLFQSIVGSSEATTGGGIYNAGTLSLVASWAINNRATGGGANQGGGGIFNEGGDVTISGNSLIAQNRANVGAGISTSAGRVRITGGGILSNVAIQNGGGIAARAVDGPSGPMTVPYDVQLTGVNLSFNIAGPTSAGLPPNQGDGGGFHSTGPGIFVVNGGQVSGNIAAHQGGGIFNGLGGSMAMTGGRVRGNYASRGFDDGATVNAGGGIFNAGNLTVTNTEIDRNVAASNGSRLGLGGGIENASAGATRLTDALVDRNSAGVGGGVHNSPPPGVSFLEVQRGRIELNEALQSGGGIANSGRLIVAGATIHGNHARADVVGQGGGGIFNDGTADIRATFITNNGAFSANPSTDALASGGGILNGPDGRLTVLDSSIMFNVARREGGGVADFTGDSEVPLNSVFMAGVFLQSNQAFWTDTGRGGGLSSEGGTIVMFRNAVIANTASLDGGGVWLDGGATLQMDETTVSSNQSGGDGGGLYLQGTAQIRTSLIAQGSARANGGGIWTNSGLTLVNSTVGQNRSRLSGGGVYVASDEGTFESVLIANATIARNRADFEPTDADTGTGGGLFIGGGEDVTLHNTVVALNIVGAGTSPPFDDIKGLLDAGSSFNFIGDGTGSSLVNGVNGNQVGTALAPIDPKLGPLADNGGPTLTYLPLADSALIDQGKDVLSTGIDQRVRRRPVDLAPLNATGGDGSDIGAVEIQPGVVAAS